MRFLTLVALASLPVLAACETAPRAPTDPGVCYSVAQQEGQELAFNVLARDQPQIETCAARLEEMRLNFLRLGEWFSDAPRPKMRRSPFATLMAGSSPP